MDYKKIVRRFYAFTFVDEFILIYPLYALLFADKGLSPGQISSLFIVWSLTAFLLEVPSGSVADKYPRKRVLQIAVLLKALAFGSWLLLPNYGGFLLGFVLWGINSAFTSGTTEALVYDELQRLEATERYTHVTGMMELFDLLAFVTSALAASLIAGQGYNLAIFASIAAVMAAAGILQTLPNARKVETTNETKYWQYLRQGVREAIHKPGLLLLLGFTSVAVGLGTIDEYYNLFLHEQGITNTQIAIGMSSIFALGGIGSLLAPRLRDRVHPAGWMLVVMAGLLWLATRLPAPFSIVGLGLFAGYYFLIRVWSGGLLQDQLTDKTRATTTSVYGLMMELWALIVFGIFAVFGGRHSYGFGLQATAAVMLVAGVAFSLLSRRQT